MRCTIVPPHILERIVERTDDPELRASARRSLVLDAAQRTERRITSTVPAAPVAETGVPNRTIKDAKNQEELPGDTVRAEGADPTGDAAADQAYDWLGATFKLYQDVYGRNSI